MLLQQERHKIRRIVFSGRLGRVKRRICVGVDDHATDSHSVPHLRAAEQQPQSMLAGRLEDAKEMLGKAERLSPRDPLLWVFKIVHAWAHVLSEDDEAAVEWARKAMQVPRAAGYWPHAVLAAALANLGRIEEARAAVAVALERKPDLSLAYLEKTLPTKEPGGLAPYLDGLRKAGLPE